MSVISNNFFYLSLKFHKYIGLPIYKKQHFVLVCFLSNYKKLVFKKYLLSAKFFKRLCFLGELPGFRQIS